jgi:hypothetical protein
MADQPELEIVLPDGRPVSEYQEPQEDMGTVVEIGISGKGGVTVEVDLPDGEDFYANIAEEIEDDEVHDSKMTDIDDNGVKKLKKLKPSGIVFFAHIDPDASSEEEVDAKNKKKDVIATQILKVTDALELDVDKLLRINMLSLTDEMVKDLKQQFADCRERLKFWKTTTPKDQFEIDLSEI